MKLQLLTTAAVLCFAAPVFACDKDKGEGQGNESSAPTASCCEGNCQCDATPTLACGDKEKKEGETTAEPTVAECDGCRGKGKGEGEATTTEGGTLLACGDKAKEGGSSEGSDSTPA